MTENALLNRESSYTLHKAYIHFVIVLAFGSFTLPPYSLAAEVPKIIQKDGRYALMVDGRPFLILGGQIHNSSAWPIELPQVWESMAALHANTVEAPIYWEQVEPEEGRFDFNRLWKALVLTIYAWCCCGSAPGRTATCTMRQRG